tara:strand:+ start:7787 stop:9103 length:1317 start_codon:yes stop_codon:yes gene_type:complete
MACANDNFKTEHQITTDFLYNHDLDNNDNFSPDDQWLVYDTRTETGGIGANGKIEKVNVDSGEKVVLYALEQNKAYGPGVGAASYSHTENQVVFIHGLLHCSPDNPYEQWRRTGVIVADTLPGVPVFMDARDASPPFTPGALRGGTHRHEWSGDGNWIGFTYNDAVMKKLEDTTGTPQNLRTIGVSKKGQKVSVSDADIQECFSGEWFSALVVKVVPDPPFGSDQISRAAWDSWVGTAGYKKSDGSQQRARAFIGTVKNTVGKNIDEVFIVDIPENIMQARENELLEGTISTFPAPPKGASQRRLTYTSELKFPGCEGVVRSSYDGSMLAFLAYDDNQIKQVFTISPNGGTPTQETFHDTDVQSGVRWHPTEYRICYVWNGAIVSKTIGDKAVDIYTRQSAFPPTNLVWSHKGRKIAYNRMVTNEAGKSFKQIFVIDL